MNRILWVDDEIDLLQPYIIYLKGKNYDVVTASNGDDALDVLTATKPDIVFLDENMPGMTGLETLQEMKRLKDMQDVAEANVCQATISTWDSGQHKPV